MTVLAVACDLLVEARSRRWILALVAAATLLLVVLALGLRFEVVDGALAATRLFGGDLGTDVRAVDVALRPLFVGASQLLFYAGILFGIVATADFAPTLLAPGRVEYLLALPVRRWHLLAGTFVGVEALVLAGAAYGGIGLTLVLWAKTGVLSAGPALAAIAAAIGFAPVYAAMLVAAIVARSAALSGGAGLLVFIAGVVAGNRVALSDVFEEGASRTAFLAVTAVLPRLSALSDLAANVAAARPLRAASAVPLVLGTLVFALALLAVGVDRFDRRDY
ncbi:MAG TPA: ABC transporter permease subunit [Anaeromyxobacter sp.]